MVFCPYCGQRFTRDEHLERHILTHTNVKPFRCLTCHMSFARRDLLQRHYAVHGRDQNQQEIPAANGMIPKSAGRTPIACVNCAKTKTRCDKKFPCSRCASRNLECTLRSTRRATKNAQRTELPPDGTVAPPPGLSNKVSPSTNQPQERHATSDEFAAPTGASGAAWAQEDLPKASQYQLTQSPHQSFLPQSQHGTNLTQLSTNAYLYDPSFIGIEDLTSSSNPSTIQSSPQFMIDWNQLQVPMDYVTSFDQPSMVLDPEMVTDPQHYDFSNGPEEMISTIYGGHGTLLTPRESPETGICSEFGTTGPDCPMPDGPRSSTTSVALTPPATETEASAMVTAHSSWSAFRCHPIVPSAGCPKTALLNLEQLEHSLRDHKLWLSWTPPSHGTDAAGQGDHLRVIPLHENTRDKLLAITQSFLHKALEIHRDGSSASAAQPGLVSSVDSHRGSDFVLLPPARVLECFIRSYSDGFERHFPFSSRGTVDVNEIMQGRNERAASLLVLMMIAQGATDMTSREARLLSGGLIEACRISLFDMVERNISLSGDPLVLRAALLFTVQAAWSGDKWQMDIAMGQRGMYLSMLRHSSLLVAAVPSSTLQQASQKNIDELWSNWINEEGQSRLVYSWAIADQELALMHDTAPLLSVTELVLPMPDADQLWRAPTAKKWSSIFERVHEFGGGASSIGSGARPPSLYELFRRFLNDDMATLGQMTPLQLRLLLIPIQSLVHQQTQFASLFSDEIGSHDEESCPCGADTAWSGLRGTQRLLKRWHDLMKQYLETNSPCTVTHTSLIIFHLISLNAVTDFGEIESLARREGFEGSYQHLQWRHSRCMHDVEEAIFHCGQVMRHIKAIHPSTRPQWWAGAIYRAGLVLWTDSLLMKDGSSQEINGMHPVPGPSWAIDALPADHALAQRYLTKREGVPCVTKRDGSLMNIDNAYDVLQHCVQLIDEGHSTRFSDAIRSKMDALCRH